MRRTLAFTLAVALLAACSAVALAAKIIPESQTVSPLDLDGQLAGKVLIDVRQEEDLFQTGQIEGSVHIVLQSLLNSSKLPAQKDAAIIIVSQDGTAGELAVLGLTKLGYTNVKNLEGGINAWVMMGMPVQPVERSDALPKGC